MLFTAPEQYLDDLTKSPLDITTLQGDWPFPWAYYDEPSNREALLLGRMRITSCSRQSESTPLSASRMVLQTIRRKSLKMRGRANVWPDHGWGGNHGLLTDAVYADYYARSKTLSDQILAEAASQLAKRAQKTADNQIPVVVYNPSSWERTDLVECQFHVPAGWSNLAVHDGTGKEVGFEVLAGEDAGILFLAEGVPSVGYKTYYLTSASAPPPSPAPLTGDTIETSFIDSPSGKAESKTSSTSG